MTRPRSPESPVFLTATWRDLAILNFEADPRLLKPLVPVGTELDAYGGRTVVSIVGFLFLDTRVAGIPVPGHRNFEEVNLRFYVRREVDGERRRGVVFVRELVPRRAVAWTARALYGERYDVAVMRHEREDVDGTRSVSYEWRRGNARGRISVKAAGESVAIRDGSEEEFIADHAWGYVGREGRTTLEYRVEHPKWRLWHPASVKFECDAATFYGPAWASMLSRPPISSFLADGSEIVVRRGRAIDA